MQKYFKLVKIQHSIKNHRVYPRKRNNNVILKVLLICVYNIYRSKRMTTKKRRGKYKYTAVKFLLHFIKICITLFKLIIFIWYNIA